MSKIFKKQIIGVMAATLVAGCISVSVAQAKSDNIFKIFDNAVISLVASGTCKTADTAAFNKFNKAFNRVYEQVENELMEMNPGKTRQQVQMLIGFRTAQLEVRTEDRINSLGCDHPEVRQASRLSIFQVSRNL